MVLASCILLKNFWVCYSLFTLPYPALLEPWVLELLLVRRRKALAFITLSPILDHGIRIHVSFSYQTQAKTQSQLKDRYSPTESLYLSFVCQFRSLKSHRLMIRVD